MTDSAAANELRAFRNALRGRLIAAREALPAELHAQLSRKMERRLGELLDALQPAVLAFCWPFRAEFDARPLVSGRLPAGLRACLPVVMDNDSPLEFREWTPQSEMIEDRYGIHIPARGEALRPDAILMPLNGFDEGGYRLGYGGGYFDRSLAALSSQSPGRPKIDLAPTGGGAGHGTDPGAQQLPRPRAIGVGFELARVASIRPQAYDLPMDFIITEAGIFAAENGRLKQR
ncbi:MAG: 5-formyltetrahydrofolate cyclo-ligase [Rhodocyclales bacterium]|nr:5-formyltetrahydrofolate cyclo-ligase [Rhodocyclales bacterium]